jgi:signal peptidase I
VVGGLLLFVGQELFLPTNVPEPYRTFSGSMEPTFLQGDTFMVDPRAYRDRVPHPGELLVYRDPESGKNYVKRCLATGGQTLAIRDDITYVDGRPLDVPQMPWAPSRVPREVAETVIPQGKCFVVGDNRPFSWDSRITGPIDLSWIEGKPLYIYFSKEFDRIGRRVE